MTRKPERRGLGRGLSSLMAEVNLSEADGETGTIPADRRLPVAALLPNPDQPRRDFPADRMEELAASIREKGVLQPLIVRPAPGSTGRYQIVAGERRWRAAQAAQVHDVPVVIRDLSDTEVLEIAIIENIQRADLNPLEEATGYRQLMERFGHTQEKLGQALGKSRSHIANLLRLLSLPEEVLDMLRNGRISAGHARALVGREDAAVLARQIVERGLSVRQVEELVRKPASPDRKPGEAGARRLPEKDADTRAIEGDLSAALGMSVIIDHEAGSNEGILRIRYKSLEDLDFLCRALSSLPDRGAL